MMIGIEDFISHVYHRAHQRPPRPARQRKDAPGVCAALKALGVERYESCRLTSQQQVPPLRRSSPCDDLLRSGWQSWEDL